MVKAVTVMSIFVIVQFLGFMLLVNFYLGYSDVYPIPVTFLVIAVYLIQLAISLGFAVEKIKG